MAREDQMTVPGNRVIAVLTDFGTADPYAGIMKGIILAKAPAAKIVDLTHEVPAQAVLQGAFLLDFAWRYFPAGTIFLVVVDPGVGSSRRRLAIEAQGMTFIGPDNGCLSTAVGSLRRELRAGESYAASSVQIGASVTAVSIENEAAFHPPISATFEGRDVFAPAAAYLAANGSIVELGPPVQEVQAFPAFRAPREGGKLAGRVIHIDTYGNLLTDIRAEDVSSQARFFVRYREAPLVHTYADATAGRLVSIAGSSGYVEIAVPSGSAAKMLAALVGDAVAEL